MSKLHSSDTQESLWLCGFKKWGHEVTWSREWFVVFGVGLGSVDASDFLEEKK